MNKKPGTFLQRKYVAQYLRIVRKELKIDGKNFRCGWYWLSMICDEAARQVQPKARDNGVKWHDVLSVVSIDRYTGID